MNSELHAKDRSVLANALSDIPQFLTPRERQTFVRSVLSQYPGAGDADKTLRFLDWANPPLVVADNLVRLLEGQEAAPGLPVLRVIAEAIASVSGTAHREELASLSRRMGWTPEPEPKAAGAAPDVPADVAAKIAAKRANKEYDVFLCHNSKDKPAVLGIANLLLNEGLLPWLDVWDLQPGIRWQPAIEQEIDAIKAAAVFVGSSGIGPWRDEEANVILSRFKDRNRPVIPVILEDAPGQIQLPAFLDARTRVDFRKKQPDPLQHLVFGITGKNPAC